MSNSNKHKLVQIAALAGRRIDASDADTARFPLNKVTSVKNKLKDVFTKQKITHLVCSAACGADLVALNIAQELGIESHIILPFSPSDFRRISVVDRPGDWGELYDKVVAEAKSKGHLYELRYSPDDEKAFSKATQTIIAKAKEIEGKSTPVAVVVWEGRSRGEDDATQEFLTLSQEAGYQKAEVLTLQ